ncbi:MAG TPA: TonB C-terminal domain-containing protein [Candidatus Angelobacter sp.]|nr:TonB C-terminal domain-containing protein [Candidatus Angelobacter sp.]
MAVMEAPVRESSTATKPESTDELHLLISELGDEISAYRWREAVWISIVVHVVGFLIIIFSPKWMPRSVVVLPAIPQKQQTTFLELPPDLLHIKTPKTNIISDKNRTAQSRTPSLEPPKPVLDARRPGPPAKPAPQAAPPQQAQQQQQPAPAQQAQQENSAAQQPVQTARAEAPPQPKGPSPFKTALGAGSVVDRAIQSSAGSHGISKVAFDSGGDYGSARVHPPSNVHGDLEILSDTMGVDFSGYLQRVLFEVRQHWYNQIPESARPPLMKKGKLTIDFSILKNGSVSGMRLVSTSGDDALDRPAWGSITGSTPFQPLPSEFGGSFLHLRFTFLYNPDKSELN